MAMRYDFKTTGGDALIPLADGTFYTDDISADFSSGQCFVEFLDSNGNQVTPDGACTVDFRSSTIEGQYLAAVGNPGVISALSVQAGDADYTPRVFDGAIKKSKVTIASAGLVTTATHFRAYHWRY